MRMRRKATLAAVAGVLVVLGSGPGARPAMAGTGVLLHAGGPGAVPDSYVVVLDDTARSSVDPTAVGRSLTSRYGGQVRHVYSSALRGFSVTASESQARRMAAAPGVSFVEQVHTVSLATAQSNPANWGLDRIDERDLPLDRRYDYPDAAGEGVQAYVIDSGIRSSHREFVGRVRPGATFLRNEGRSSGDGTGDCNGHGTHVSGILGGSTYGVAKKVQIHPVRVLDCFGSGFVSDIISAVDWVTHEAEHPTVVNMSLGSDGVAIALEQAIRSAIQQGITFVVAAGNTPTDACQYTPTRMPTVITVSSTSNTDTRAADARFGSCVDIFAPGVNITSAWHLGDTSTNTISGTSMASPHVAGAAALLYGRFPTATPAQIQTILLLNATRNRVRSPGTGSPNVLLFIGLYDFGPFAGRASLIQSNLGVSDEHNNFELVMQEGDHVAHFFRDNSDPTSAWQRGQTFATGVTGPPVLIQSSHGEPGNFEVAVPQGDELVHYWRDNADTSTPWQQGPTIATGTIGGASLIQSNLGSGDDGNLELLVQENDHVAHFFRDNTDPTSAWQRGQTFGLVVGAPTMIQSDIGEPGNFEVVVAVIGPQGIGFRHYWRDNADTTTLWQSGGMVP